MCMRACIHMVRAHIHMVHARVHVCTHTHRCGGQRFLLSSFFPPCGFHGSGSDGQTWLQGPLLNGPSPLTLFCFVFLKEDLTTQPWLASSFLGFFHPPPPEILGCWDYKQAWPQQPHPCASASGASSWGQVCHKKPSSNTVGSLSMCLRSVTAVWSFLGGEVGTGAGKPACLRGAACTSRTCRGVKAKLTHSEHQGSGLFIFRSC